MKNNIKIIIAFIFGLVISGFGAYALAIASKDVSYDNTTSGSTKENVQEAIDELYEKYTNKVSYKNVQLGTSLLSGNSYRTQLDKSLKVGDTVGFNYIVNASSAPSCDCNDYTCDSVKAFSLGSGRYKVVGFFRISTAMISPHGSYDYTNLRFIDINGITGVISAEAFLYN